MLLQNQSSSSLSLLSSLSHQISISCFRRSAVGRPTRIGVGGGRRDEKKTSDQRLVGASVRPSEHRLGFFFWSHLSSVLARHWQLIIKFVIVGVGVGIAISMMHRKKKEFEIKKNVKKKLSWTALALALA